MSQYQPPKGHENFVAVEVTHKGGQELETPQMEFYRPEQWPDVSRLVGFKGTVKHDPRTAGQKQEPAPAANTVKTSDKLETDEDYRSRYRVLFREEAPYNMEASRIREIVDGAEKKLAENLTGKAPVENPANSSEEADQNSTPAEKLPKDKAGWFALYQEQFPNDTTAYDDITVADMRDKLRK